MEKYNTKLFNLIILCDKTYGMYNNDQNLINSNIKNHDEACIALNNILPSQKFYKHFIVDLPYYESNIKSSEYSAEKKKLYYIVTYSEMCNINVNNNVKQFVDPFQTIKEAWSCYNNSDDKTIHNNALPIYILGGYKLINIIFDEFLYLCNNIYLIKIKHEFNCKFNLKDKYIDMLNSFSYTQNLNNQNSYKKVDVITFKSNVIHNECNYMLSLNNIINITKKSEYLLNDKWYLNKPIILEFNIKENYIPRITTKNVPYNYDTIISNAFKVYEKNKELFQSNKTKYYLKDINNCEYLTITYKDLNTNNNKIIMNIVYDELNIFDEFPNILIYFSSLYFFFKRNYLNINLENGIIYFNITNPYILNNSERGIKSLLKNTPKPYFKININKIKDINLDEKYIYPDLFTLYLYNKIISDYNSRTADCLSEI